MELIYIYVENYKVLDKAEISLSSFYKVKKTKNTFHIENSDVPPSFYKDNIDIIAIFGKNGSGKSTCIEMIQKILSFEIEEDINFIAIFKIDNSFYFYSELSNNIEVTYNESPIPELYGDDFKIDISLLSKKDKIIYFSHQVEPLKQKAKKQKNIIDCSNQHYINSIGKEPFIQNEIKSCFSLLDIYDMAGFGLNKIPMSGVIHTPSVIFKNLKSTIKNIKDLVALFLEERDSNLFRTEIDIEKVREAISSIQSIYKINSTMEQSNKSDDNFHYKNIEEL
ncbi:MAG: ABC transporter ATP-binding protein, partial [Fusobacteriaceae bacterium]